TPLLPLLPLHSHPPHLHSFPTRRSSDLNRKTKLTIPHTRCRASVAISRNNASSNAGNSSPTCSLRAVKMASEELTTQLSANTSRSEEHTSELQSREKLVCRLLLENKNV